MIRRLGAGAGRICLLQVMTPDELAPSAIGAARLEDIEGGHAELVVDGAAVAAYRERLARHQDGWRAALSGRGAGVVTVRSDEDLWKAVRIRHAAYARHVPEFAKTLSEPEAADYDADVVVLLAASKLDGSPLGSCRIQTNLHRPLGVEASVELPAWLQGRRLAEVTRLGIDEGRIGRVVKIALIKAAFEYCESNRIDWAVVTGRSPIDRQYEQLLFSDVFEDKAPVPLRHVGNIPHRVMAFEIASGEARWSAAGHPLLKFFRFT